LDERIAWSDEPNRLPEKWKELTSISRSSPKLWMDAYLAAFAITGKYRLVTTDQGFKQFKGLNLHLLT
jgi:predicted nucleic acid-binding protein